MTHRATKERTGLAAVADGVITVTSLLFFALIGNRLLSQELDTENPLISLDLWGVVGLFAGAAAWIAVAYLHASDR